AERPVAFVGAQLTMIGVVDGGERIDAGSARRLQLVALQLTLVGRKNAEVHALQPDRRLVEVDEFEPGYCAEDGLGGFNYAGDARMFVQGDADRDALAQQRPQGIEPALEEQHERRHLERPRAALALDSRQSRLRELHVAARTPGH